MKTFCLLIILKYIEKNLFYEKTLPYNNINIEKFVKFDTVTCRNQHTNVPIDIMIFAIYKSLYYTLRKRDQNIPKIL